jgi:antagonist of KipI
MAIYVIHTGIQASVQDMGRKGYRRFGVPVGGCMDKQAARIANVLCGNPPETAVLELVLHGAKLCTDQGHLLCFTGGGAEVFVNDFPVPTYRPVWVAPGSEVAFRYHAEGCRLYMAVAGGLDTTLVLGSKSHSDVLGMNRLATGSCLQVGSPGDVSQAIALQAAHHPKGMASFAFRPPAFGFAVRFLKGAEWSCFSQDALDHWASGLFRITPASNRMGYRLEGEPLQTKSSVHMLSTSVMPGTVQVTPDGTALLLMADAQTTGGYPRIAQVIDADLSICAQLRLGSDIRFIEICLEEAIALSLVQKRFIHDLESSVRINFCG